MPRRKSPHGTYAAYKRHLSENTPVCGPCRQAQSDHDGNRLSRFDRRVTPPAAAARTVAPAAESESELESASLQNANWSQAREAFQRCTIDLLSMAHDDYLYGVIDVMDEMVELLETWTAGYEQEHGPVTPS